MARIFTIRIRLEDFDRLLAAHPGLATRQGRREITEIQSEQTGPPVFYASVSTEGQASPPVKVALYARDSADNQDRSEPVEAQLEAIREYAAGNELEPVMEYIDTDGRRDQFERMMAHAARQDPPFQKILVYDLSRFSRSAQELQEQTDKLAANGVTLISVVEHA